MDPTKIPAPQETKLHFLDYWRIIRIRKTVILAVFLLVVITATLVTFILPESFSSTARIKIEREQSDIEGFTKPNYVGAYDPYFIQTEFEVIQSELILKEVVELLDLNTVWGRKYAGGEKLKTSESITYLKASMDLRPVRNTSLIEIRVFSQDPIEAARLANTIARVYHDHRLAKGQKLITNGIKTLKDQFEEQEQKVREAQKDADKLRKDLNISDADANGNSPAPQLEADVVRQLQAQLVTYDTHLVTEETTVEELNKLSPERRRDAFQTSVGPDSELNTLLGELNIAEQKLLSLKKDYAPDHPTMLNAKMMAEDSLKRVTSRVE